MRIGGREKREKYKQGKRGKIKDWEDRKKSLS
jgi:hypothetical protein